MHLSNAFSLNMLGEYPATIEVEECGLDTAKVLAKNSVSAVGHADTAAVFSDVLGQTVPANRTTVLLQKGEQLLVGQYVGPRLPEGSTTLPEGATIKWLLITVK